MAETDIKSLLTQQTANELCELAELAGKAILEIYESDDFETRQKEDDSPLTAADLAANKILVDGLEALTPRLPVLSEESKQIAFEERSQWTTFWMVDPLDGTKEFIKRNGEFTVNIALIHEGKPVLGVVHAPELYSTYWGFEGGGAFKKTRMESRPIFVGDSLRDPVTVVVSRSHLRDSDKEFIARLEEAHGEVDTAPTGSSLKLCLVAEGGADVYPRFGPTMEWDIAAAQAVLEQAGGVIATIDGEPMRYNKEELVNPLFIARTPALELPE
ncbi:MAG: 3'(2'),5'-bisphosphate nucleotidase CysQ [Myxococcota bacterium]